MSAAIQDAREEPPKNYIREINDYRLDLSTVDISTLLSDSDEVCKGGVWVCQQGPLWHVRA